MIGDQQWKDDMVDIAQMLIAYGASDFAALIHTSLGNEEALKVAAAITVSLESQTNTDPDTEDEIETHRQCIHFTPIMMDTNLFFSSRKQYLRQGVKGNCYEGGYTEIGNPDECIHAHEDGCNAFKKSEPFATNDMVMPLIENVIHHPIHTTLLAELYEEYDRLDYQIRFKGWEEKPEYCELHSVTEIYHRGTNELVDTKRWAFIKSHMTGEIQSV